MARKIIMTLSLIIVILFTIDASLFQLNGSTTGEIANRLPVLFVPSHYVFMIWFVIYSMLFYWITAFKNDPTIIHATRIRFYLFLLSSIWSLLWVYLWHFEYFLAALIIKFLLMVTLFVLYRTYQKKENNLTERIPISLYFSWTFIGCIGNLNYVLMLYEWSGWGLSDPLWTVIFMTIVAATALHFMYHYRDIAVNITFIWALTGIIVKNKTEELFVSAAALFLIIVMIWSLVIFKQSKKKET